MEPLTEEKLENLSDAELKEMFAKALSNFWNEPNAQSWEDSCYVPVNPETIENALNAGEITWNDIFFRKKVDTIQELFANLIKYEVIDINEYKTPNEFIIKNIQTLSTDFTYTCNGETVTGEKAKFIITNPKPTIIATSISSGQSAEIVWNEYPTGKIETYSSTKAIAESGKNSQTITAKDMEFFSI